MPGWPSGWRERALRASGVPITQFALDVLSAWRTSTPTEPWTNNPLGMPVQPGGGLRALHTPYGMFLTIGDFTDALKRFLRGSKGQAVLHELISADSLASTWREIHGLKWPANKTETDYPCALLDMVEEAYRAKLSRNDPAKRKSAGSQLAPPSAHAMVRAQAAALHEASTQFSDGATAIAHIIRRFG